MSKAHLLVICLLAASFTGCMGGDDECSYTHENPKTILDEDEYYTLSLGEGHDRFRYDFERHDDEGHEVDIYFLDKLNLDKFESDSSFEYIESLSKPATTSMQFSLKGDGDSNEEYFLVLDNSNRGDSSPPSDLSNNKFNFSIDFTADYPISEGGCPDE